MTLTDEERERAERNRLMAIGHYFGVVDAQGYPNGMRTWSEMDVHGQLHTAYEADGAVRKQAQMGLVTIIEPLGLRTAVDSGNLYIHLIEKRVEDLPEDEKKARIEEFLASDKWKQMVEFIQRDARREVQPERDLGHGVEGADPQDPGRDAPEA